MNIDETIALTDDQGTPLAHKMRVIAPAAVQIVNPSAVGDPDETPIVHIPDGPSGDALRSAIATNTRLWLRERCAVCGNRREEGHINDHTFSGEQADHEFVDKPLEERLADQAIDFAEVARSLAEAPPPPSRADLLQLVDAAVTAAGQHRDAAVAAVKARRDLETSVLEAALAARETAHEAERAAVRALRDAITRVVAA